MEGNPSLLRLFSLVLSLFVAQSHGKRQSDALADLQKRKLNGNSGIDTSLFEVTDASDFEAIRQVDVSNNHPQEGSKEKDLIHRLPGQPPVNFLQYGGYVTVNKTSGRAFYYYFVEAENSKESLPLLIWLNGGPGCSALGFGAMEELGPFRVHSDGKTLFRNRFAWNKAANVLFVESPAGVGFSYSNTSSEYFKSGDRQTANDNYAFLVNWLERFPEYKGREVYISGESYAGHFVPEFAHTILHHNKKANRTIINLKGIIIGNAAIDDDGDNRGMYDFFASHAIASVETVKKVHQYCYSSKTKNISACEVAENQAYDETGYIDIYNIYAPVCFSSNVTARPKRASVSSFDPCSDYYVVAYLNRPDVQQAMHANVTKLNHDWQPCSHIIRWNDSPSTVLPLIHEFLTKGLRVWIFSGDIDGRVPVTSTQYSIYNLKLSTKIAWRAWYHKYEVGGYTQVYQGDLTFATVRGAGHQVPSYQPARALALIKHFLAGTPLPPAKNFL